MVNSNSDQIAHNSRIKDDCKNNIMEEVNKGYFKPSLYRMFLS